MVPFALHIHLHLHLQNRHVHGSPIGYAGLALAAAASWIGLPGPGEAALVTAGVLASHSKLNLGPVLLYAFLAATAGGIGGWVIGLKAGRALVLAPGPLLGARAIALHRGEWLFERYGVLAVFMAPSWVAGINGMSAARYLPLNALSAAGWALLFGLGAYFVGPSITDVVDDVGLIVGIVVGSALVVALIVAWRNRHRLRAQQAAGD